MVAGAVLGLHIALVAWGALRHSPCIDEVAHLPAGVSHWKTGSFGLYKVNPPLVRSIAAIPTVLFGPPWVWKGWFDAPLARPEWGIGHGFIDRYRGEAFWQFTLARWFCIPFTVLGAGVCFAWAKSLYGPNAGLLALVLWCLCPNMIANAQMITPDTGVTALGLTASFLFWRWLRSSTWTRATWAGLLLGLAALAKFTGLVFFAVWPTLWLIDKWKPQTQIDRDLSKRDVRQLLFILLLALYVINLGYGFEGSLTPLEDYRFVSDALAGQQKGLDQAGNRFAGTLAGALPVPLPKYFLLGNDFIKHEFEERYRSFLAGEWRLGGWWYYYIYALAIKVPIGTWLLVLLSAVLTLIEAVRKKGQTHWEEGVGFRVSGVGLKGDKAAQIDSSLRNEPVIHRSDYSAGWRDEMVLLVPALAILVLVSSQTGFNHHLRYVLPIFPFLFVWSSKVACCIGRNRRFVSATVCLATAWMAVSSLAIYPHSLSYFNEIVGGPRNGHLYLSDSNVDWGQDLFYLKEWLDAHPQAEPIGLVGRFRYDPLSLGINWHTPNTWPPSTIVTHEAKPGREGPQPGWYAISVVDLHAPPEIEVDNGNETRYPAPGFDYFQFFEPVDRIGYSMNIYHITLEECNALRRKLGLEPLPEG